MAWLALSPDDLVPTASIAEKTKVPTHYLAKVLQQLSNAGLIAGRRGVRGGYRLARPADAITLKDVVNAVAPVERITSCPLGLSNHGSNLCPLHRLMDRVAASVIEILDDKTLAQLVEDGGTTSKPLCDSETTARLTIKGVWNNSR